MTFHLLATRLRPRLCVTCVIRCNAGAIVIANRLARVLLSGAAVAAPFLGLRSASVNVRQLRGNPRSQSQVAPRHV